MDQIVVRDGVALARRRWQVADAVGTVVLMHGIAEHSGRYGHVAAQLNAWGWHVESFDHRGHGLSEGSQGGLHRDDDLVEDLAAVLAAVRRERPTGPLLLMGHSMGGLIAACYVADQLMGVVGRHTARAKVDGLVMVSPALDVSGTVPLLGRLAMATFGRLLPDVRVRTGFDSATICSDFKVVQAYRHDPLVHDLISARMARFIIRGGERVRALAPRWRMPTLLLYAGSDRIVHPGGSRAFADAAPATVRARCFAHMAHEILNEPDQADVFAAMGEGLCWLRTMIGEEPGLSLADPAGQARGGDQFSSGLGNADAA